MKEELKENENFICNKFGYCYYSINPTLIYNLYVEPQYRKQGHSEYLLKYVINEIRKSYRGEIYIEAIPREESIPLEKLIMYYKKLGLIIK
jgi:GNAT superfamily N-acetyltransferase